MNEGPHHSLVELGFTALEADAYVLLLQKPLSTGYKVAQQLGKPAANVYKALESLERKGAVVVDDTNQRIYRPVPPDELIRQLESRFRSHKEAASEALRNLGGLPPDEGIYRLSTAEQVRERCLAAVEASTFAVLLDSSSSLLEELGPSLKSAAERGVHALAKVYEPLALDGVRTLMRPRPEQITEASPGPFLALAADGKEFLLARFRRSGEVWQALWTRNPMLAFQGYMGLINELSLTAIMQCLENEPTIEEVRAAFERDRPLHPNTSRNPVFDNLQRSLP